MTAIPDRKIDPITAQVIGGALENIAIDMGHRLARMSYSSIIRESEDFGAALLDAQGRQLAESVDSTPLQLGPIPGYMRGIFSLLAERGETIEPGDVIMHNSAYHGASHGPDVGFCVPAFHEGQLIGFAFTTAHHLDIGSLHPGSTGIVDAVDAYAEGLQFKAIKVYQQGRKNEAVWQILRDNIRAPQMVVGDMEAQIAACQHGAARFIELVGQYGLSAVTAASEELMDYSERMLRAQIAKLPDGVYSAEGFIDGYIDSEKPEEKNLKIAVTLTVQDSDIQVDFTGTSPQVDLPINMPFIGTVDIAVYLVIRSILLDSALIDYVPQNDGLTRPITITAPKGTLTNPNFPAPTIARFCPGNIVADTVMRALSQVAPHNISAGVGNLQVVAYSGPTADDNYWVYMDITEGSYGGRDGKDGMDAVDTLFANTRNNPIEDIESHYPLRVTRYELRENAAGAGKWRGGLGSIREIQFLEPGRFGVEGDGHCFAPWGVFGGQEGTTGGLALINGTQVRQLPSKIADRRSQPGDILRTVSPCGGGYGNPLERDPQWVLDDVADEYVSLESARLQYGVVIHQGQIDEAATAQERQGMRDQG